MMTVTIHFEWYWFALAAAAFSLGIWLNALSAVRRSDWSVVGAVAAIGGTGMAALSVNRDPQVVLLSTLLLGVPVAASGAYAAVAMGKVLRSRESEQ